MRGHQPLIAMRMNRQKPNGVWISHGSSPLWATWDKFADSQPYPEIEILQKEVPESLDLRFVVGLTVHVSGCSNSTLARRLHKALLVSKAKRVITTTGDLVIDSEHGEWGGYVPE